MFGFIKKICFTVMTFFSCNVLKCVSMNNQEGRIRLQITNIKSNEPLFYLYSIGINKCSSSNNINYPQPKLYVPDVVKYLI